MKDIKLQPGEVLVSYDVTALFTAIPTDAATEVMKQKLLDDWMIPPYRSEPP